MTTRRYGDNPNRRIKGTLYAVTAFYVVIGCLVAIPSALAGDRVGSFLGFMIVIGALAAAAVVGAVLRLSACVADIDDRIQRLSGLLERTLARAPRGSMDPSASKGTRMMDLASVGKGDAGVLTAATLEGSTFPRLVTTMEERPPAEAAQPAPSANDEREPRAPARAGLSDEGDAPTPTRADFPSPPEPPASARAELLDDWGLAFRDGDLTACRAVYSALVDTADSETLASLEKQLTELADRTERSLRAAFTDRATHRDFAGMLEIGRQICGLLPDRPVAAEFRRLKPHLQRRHREIAEPPPSLRVVR